MPKPSVLFGEPQKPAFAKWWERLIDLPAMVQKDTRTYDELYTAFYGASPGGSAPAQGPRPPASSGPGDAFPSGGGGPEGAPPDDPFGDVGGPGDIDMPGAEMPAPVRPAVTPPRRPGRR